MKTVLTTQLKTGILTLLLITSLTSCKKTDKVEETITTEEATETTMDSENDNAGDATFFADLAIINREQIELSKQAETRATAKEVKEYAAMLVESHSKSLKELTDLANKKGIALGEELSEDGKKTIDELSSTKEKNFQKLYMAKMVAEHQDAITKLETTRDNTADAEVKSWITKTLPEMQMHLDKAIETQQKLKI